MEWFVAVVIVAALGVAAVAAAGGLGAMAKEPVRDVYRQDLPADRPLAAADIQGLRFGTALRGYAMGQVDDVLDRLAREISERDAMITQLRVIAGMHGGPDADSEPEMVSVEARSTPVGSMEIGQQQAGPTQAGSTPVGSMEVGQQQAGPTQAGSTPVGSMEVGQEQAGPTQAGPTQAGPTQAGPTPAGPTPVGSMEVGQQQAGPTQAGPTPAGPTQAGPTQAGPSAERLPSEVASDLR